MAATPEAAGRGDPTADPLDLDSAAVETRELTIPDAWVLTPRQFDDDRGTFLEFYRAEVLAGAVGHPLRLAQGNCSVSQRGVVRGIHFATVPPSQAKYVSCLAGAILDVVIDIRVGSPTFGQWEAVRLDDVDRRSVYVSEGLGHAFMALEDDTMISYLCTATYNPGREHGVHPLDPALGIDWPTTGRDGSPLAPLLSAKDTEAPTLAEAREQGLLPDHAEVQDFLSGLGDWLRP